MNHRNASRLEILENVPKMRLDVGTEVLWPERPHPRIEELNSLYPCVDLCAQEPPHDLGELARQLVPECRLFEHQALREEIVAALLPLDEIARQSKRPSSETDQRRFPLQLTTQEPNRFEDV